MSKRLQVVMDDEEYEEIQQAADAARLTVSAWVRQMLRIARYGVGPVAPPVPVARRPLATYAPKGSGHPHPERASASEPDASGTSGPAPDAEMLRDVMARHGLSSMDEALDFALQKAVEAAPEPEDLMGLRGTGWSGDLGGLRSGAEERTTRGTGDQGE
jgi:Arc/MetJ family transcription regulator